MEITQQVVEMDSLEFDFFEESAEFIYELHTATL